MRYADSHWTLCQVPMVNLEHCFGVSLPMNLHESLFSEKIIPDLFDTNTNWVGESDWTLSRVIDSVDPESWLHVGGISTHANIFANDVFIGNVSNAFTDFRTEIPDTRTPLKVTVYLNSPIKAGRVGQVEDPQVPSCPPLEQEGLCGVQHLRIPQYLFGWDWGIATASVTVDAIEVESAPSNCDFQYLIDTKIANSSVWNLSVRFLARREGEVGLTVIDSSGGVVISVLTELDQISLDIEDVKPWYPRGYGDPERYSMQVTFKDCKPRETSFGFRQVQRVQKGKQWFLRFNGDKDIFIKGVNVVPSSAFRDANKEEILRLLDNIEDLDYNLLRQWGGGWYGSDFLYEEANKRGFLVWEELKLACATYPAKNEEWLSSLKTEIESNLNRAYNNPSLVIVSGDNEIDKMLSQNWFNQSATALEGYEYVYSQLRHEIADIVNAINDAGFVFIPTSPAEGTDVHFYDNQNDCTDWRIYPFTESLVSEYGFQAWAALDLDELDWKKSRVIFHRNHRKNGNSEIWDRSLRMFPDLENRTVTAREFIWTSRLSQAVCVKAATEAFRRRKEITAGLILWQLNDVWPTASWSLVDYSGLKKPAYFSAKSSMSNNLISLFVDRDELVVVALASSEPVTIEIIHLFTGKRSTRSTNRADQDIDEVLRLNLASVCPDKQCVAAHSPSNYILLGPVARARKPYPLPTLQVTAFGFNVSVSIPTPFLYIPCDVYPNFVFLAPNVWNGIEVRGEDCVDPQVSSLWSFSTEISDDKTYSKQFI